MRVAVLPIIAFLAVMATPAAAAQRDTVPFIPLGQPTAAPRGYEEMCRSHGEWCASKGEALVADRHVWAAMPVALSLPVDVGQILQWAAAPSSPPPIASDIILSNGPRHFRLFDTLAPMDVAIIAPIISVEGLGVVAPVAMPAPAGDLPSPDVTIDIAAPAPEPVLTVTAEREERAPARSKAMARRGTRAPELALLKKINQRVNGRVVQRRDSLVFGEAELWRRSGVGQGAMGDCEDLAIEKRLQLVAEGFAPEKLAYAVVYDRSVGLHTVLVARTRDGDVVLDSATPYVTPWDKARYSWISVQSMEAPGRWFSVASARAG